MTTEHLLSIVKERGLELELQGDRIVIKRTPETIFGVTDKLLAVLKRHRERIIEHLKKSK